MRPPGSQDGRLQHRKASADGAAGVFEGRHVDEAEEANGTLRSCVWARPHRPGDRGAPVGGHELEVGAVCPHSGLDCIIPVRKG